jgi:DNA ligase-4
MLNLIDPHVKAQIRKGVSVIKPDWIFESIKRKKALPLIKEWVG